MYEVQVENYFNILAVDESLFHLFFPPTTLFPIIFVKIDYGGKFLGECTELYVLVFFGEEGGVFIMWLTKEWLLLLERVINIQFE